MHFQATLVAALAGSAVAITDLRPDRVRRDLLPRQTSDASADPCLNALATVYSNAPTPPPKVVSYEMTATAQTDPCSITVPAEISSDYASYTSQVLSWVDANSASIMSALSQCSTLTDFATELPVCTSAASGGDSGGKATGTAEGASGSAGPTGNAGPRETAMVAAAAAAAGFVGVAAFL